MLFVILVMDGIDVLFVMIVIVVLNVILVMDGIDVLFVMIVIVVLDVILVLTEKVLFP